MPVAGLWDGVAWLAVGAGTALGDGRFTRLRTVLAGGSPR